jgi:hypothetical protein
VRPSLGVDVQKIALRHRKEGGGGGGRREEGGRRGYEHLVPTRDVQVKIHSLRFVIYVIRRLLLLGTTG